MGLNGKIRDRPSNDTPRTFCDRSMWMAYVAYNHYCESAEFGNFSEDNWKVPEVSECDDFPSIKKRVESVSRTQHTAQNLTKAESNI